MTLLSVRFGRGPVSVGDRLTQAVRYKERQYPHELELPAVVEEVVPVDVMIEWIGAYGKEFQTLGCGYTAVVRVSGLDTSRNWDGWVFGTLDAQEMVLVS